MTNSPTKTFQPSRLSSLSAHRSTFLLLLLSAFIFLLSSCKSSGEDLNEIIRHKIDEWKGPDNVDAAADLFNATNPDARRIAVAYISQKPWGHEPPYMKAYHVLATSDPDALVRGQALLALGTSNRADVAPDLLTGLAHRDPIVRRDAATALQTITNPIAIEPLLNHLQIDPDYQVRYNVAQALKNYPNNPRVLRLLAQAIDDKVNAVGHAALISLQALTGQTFPEEPRPWLDWIDAHYPTTAPATQPG